MKIRSWFVPLVLAAIVGATVTGQQQSPPASRAAQPAAQVRLPAGIVWETNDEDPPIGSSLAQRGGTLRMGMDSYPLTFRLVGPNSNDAFAGWNRLFTLYMRLVQRHPVTDRYIPWLATHWSIQEDQRTIYFRLDPDARWSDGDRVTADDYVFTLEMMRSKHIVDPFYTTYAEQYYESVDKIDDYTLRIVGKRPSWRPLFDYAELWPTPSHTTRLDESWVTRTNNQPQIAVGPYVVTSMETGQSVTFGRVPDWWGDSKRRFQGLWNFDRIHLPVVPLERQLDFLRRGAVDMIVEPTARTWNEEYTFPEVRNGWLRRARVFVDVPSGVSGLHMNLEAPIFQNKNFRKAMQHLFNFNRLNRNLMYNEYFRQLSFFEGTEFASPDLQTYDFDPAQARDYLLKAGYRRPGAIQDYTLLGGLRSAIRGLILTRTDTDDILVNHRGEKASFSVVYGSRGLERHLTVMQQEYRRAGVDMRLQLLEGGTAFARGLERKYEMTMTSRTTAFYPDPRQYLHTDFQKSTNNNNIWGFGSAEVDQLIRVYEENLDPKARLDAMHRIDEIVHDEAFYIPFWTAPYSRLAHWDYVQFPDFYLPKRTEQLIDFMVYWIDSKKQAQLAEDMKAGRTYPVNDDLDKDFYGIRQRFQ